MLLLKKGIKGGCVSDGKESCVWENCASRE